MTASTLLVTGAAGFIGSHTVLELLHAGFHVIGLDNFSNSQMGVLERINTLKDHDPQALGLEFKMYEADVRDAEALRRLFRDHSIQGVVHFAGLKAVGESFLEPLAYWENNVGGTMTLLQVMKEFRVSRLAFSSSALVYGLAETFPILETASTQVLSPYARTKWVCEQFLQDFSRAHPEWSISLLRYFNPVGAHPSGLLGEMPKGVPNNLMPFVSQVAAGLRDQLSIFGADYDTPDGTCIRDYIHVVDLAKAHVAALEALLPRSVDPSKAPLCPMKGVQTFNLGTGKGVSVKELVDTFERVTGVAVARQYTARRAGDVPVLYADVSKAERLLAWRAEKTLEQMCQDAWRWQSNLRAQDQSSP